jgi:hypothetical protein
VFDTGRPPVGSVVDTLNDVHPPRSNRRRGEGESLF